MTGRSATRVICLATLLGAFAASPAQRFQLPTANQALFDKGRDEAFFVGTEGKPWTSGTFGCVRSEGWQMHEGLDIRCLQRDQRGEPTDPVLATADGQVAYLNVKPSLSTYGNYIVLRHHVDGIEVYSLYAHLREIRRDLKPGQSVRAGETIGIMGRTANTRQSISKDRAHVHFELCLLINERFAGWYKKHSPGQRNDHGMWNGQNLAALDPRQILLEQRRLGTKFNLLAYLRSQTELCRVLVGATDFPWLRRYAPLVRPNPKTATEGVAGYEITLNFNAVPIELMPRAASEIKGKSKLQLLSVNESEQRKHPCRKLVTKRTGRWELTTQGQNALGLLTY